MCVIELERALSTAHTKRANRCHGPCIHREFERSSITLQGVNVDANLKAPFVRSLCKLVNYKKAVPHRRLPR